MSSILTNNGAMVALQTLKSINNDLSSTQSQISTGKAVATAKDNASVWAISKVMESDVKGFQGISDSLALGQSTLAVAASASETVTDLLTDIKGKIVAAQESNVDRDKIQTDIDALTNQIKSVTGAAQFNGLNLVKGRDDVNVLSSLDRSSDGSVKASDIKVARQDLTSEAGVYGTGDSLSANAVVADSATAATSTGNTAVITLTGDFDTTAVVKLSIGGEEVTYTAAADDQTATNVADYFTAEFEALGLEGFTIENTAGEITVTSTTAFDDLTVTLDASGGTTGGGAGDGDITSLNGTGSLTLSTGDITKRAEQIDFSSTADVNEGDSYRVTIGTDNYDYIANAGDTMEEVAKGLKAVIDDAAIEGVSTNVIEDSGTWSLEVDNDGTGSASLALSAAGAEDGELAGGLYGLDMIDVTTDEGADAALTSIESLISTAIDASAAFGSAQGRIETQSTFISNLTDSLKSGIGSMVDADMEEASARLQALQVQQQLGVQSLSIANQSPQTILSLFR